MNSRKRLAETMKMRLWGCIQSAKDSRRRHTSLEDVLASRGPASDQPAGNEHPETAVANAETKETKLAVLLWEQTDIFLSNAGGEDDC